MTPKDEAARDAERLRISVWGDRFPVDPVRIARKLGIHVLDSRLPRNVSGALVKERGEDPTILLHQKDSANRKRFTCAHELGHFVRRSDNPDEYEYVDLRDTLGGDGTGSRGGLCQCIRRLSPHARAGGEAPPRPGI